MATNLRVTTLNGNCHEVEADGNWTTKDLKYHLEPIVSVPPHQQRILLGCRELNDAEVFGDLFPSSSGPHEVVLLCCESTEKADIMTSLVLGRTKLADLDLKFREDREVVEAAVHTDGLQLAYAAGRAKKDKGIIFAALRKNGFALSYAPEFQTDREAVLIAAKSNAFSITLASTQLQRDPEFVAQAVYQNAFVKDHLEKAVVKDMRFQEAIKKPAPRTEARLNSTDVEQTDSPDAMISVATDAKPVHTKTKRFSFTRLMRMQFSSHG